MALKRCFPKGSFVRGVSTHVGVILAITMVITLFVYGGFCALTLMAIFSIMVILSSGVSLGAVFGDVGPLTIVVVVASILGLFCKRNRPLIALFNELGVARTNVYATVFVSIEVVLLIIINSLLACAAAPASLASTVRELFSPLGIFGLSIRSITVAVAVTLHFVPALVRRVSGVATTRGSHKTSLRANGLIRETGTLIPVLVPLFVSSFEHTGRLTCTVSYHYCGNNRNHAGVGRIGVTNESCTSLVSMVIVFTLMVCVGALSTTIV